MSGYDDLTLDELRAEVPEWREIPPDADRATLLEILAEDADPVPILLVCPECHQSDELKSVERVLGHLGMTLAVVENTEGEGEVVFDYHDSTEMFWDTSETVGVHCKNCDYDDCDNDDEDGAWLERLIARQPGLKED